MQKKAVIEIVWYLNKYSTYASPPMGPTSDANLGTYFHGNIIFDEIFIECCWFLNTLIVVFGPYKMYHQYYYSWRHNQLSGR